MAYWVQWIDIFEAFLEEAKWFNKGQTPSFDEYLKNGVTSAGSYMALVHSFFLIGDDLSNQNISMMNPYPRLFTVSGQILRLWDDLGTSTVHACYFLSFRPLLCIGI